MTTQSKQVSKRNTPQQLQIELNAIDPMQLTEAYALLMVITVYQGDNFKYDARTVIAQALGCSEVHIGHCIAGTAKLGDEAWKKVVSCCGEKARLIRDFWLQELERRYPNPQS